MPRIIQIIDVDSSGHKCRMDDGELAFLPHDPGCVPCIGEELELIDGRWSAVPGGLPHLTVERANSPAQVAANIASELIAPRENVKRMEPDNALDTSGRPTEDGQGDNPQA